MLTDEQRKEAERAYNKAWREANPGYQKAWHEAHRDEENARSKAYYRANREAILARKKTRRIGPIVTRQHGLTETEREAQKKAYREANRERARAYNKAYHEGKPERARASNKAYREANREKVLARKKLYREANREKVLAAQKAWRQANRERVLAFDRARWKTWADSHPDARAASQARRRARAVSATGTHTAADRVEILQLQKHRCAYCRDSLKKDRGTHPSGRKRSRYHIDHIIPLAAGGTDDRLNLQATCPTCNTRKHTKHPIAFARELGMLL